ncbi:MAG: hypothetical protein H7Y43_09825 [Akkermansiaceae bacterium]|nr:hypothetical protein [Verrucomicrobiales bacterium]
MNPLTAIWRWLRSLGQTKAVKQEIDEELRFHIEQRTAQNIAGSALGVAALLFASPTPAAACTIFVLTDGDRTLFFNNEDFSNPATRIWFVPAGKNFLGCAYVGFDDGWAQGGVNTAGVAFDWVAGAMTKWEPDAALKPVRGNPAQRMLESCTTVEEGIAFFRQHREPSFARARIMIADRTGASVIIGVRDNQFEIERSTSSRGFGYGGQTLAPRLAKSPAPHVAKGLPILRECAQRGENATKYSTIYDLRTGDIQVFSPVKDADGVALNLASELAKGGHYYDMPQLLAQREQPPRALRNEMKRFYLDEFPPMEDREPEVTKRIQRLIQDSAQGTMKAEDYAPEFWKAVAAERENIRASLGRLGDFVSVTLVGRSAEDGQRGYRYRVEFEKMFVLQRFVLDKQNKVRLIQSEATEPKPGVRLNNE